MLTAVMVRVPQEKSPAPFFSPVDAYSLGILSGNNALTVSGLIGKLNDVDYFTFTAAVTGKVNVTVAGTHGLEPAYTVIGIETAFHHGTWSFDVMADETYIFFLQTTAGHGIGYYDLQIRGVPEPSTFALVAWCPLLLLGRCRARGQAT